MSNYWTPSASQRTIPMTALQMGGLNSKVTLAPLFKGAGVAKRLEKSRQGKKVEQSSGVSLEEAADYFGGDIKMARTFLGLLHPEAGEDDAAVTVLASRLFFGDEALTRAFLSAAARLRARQVRAVP